MSSRSAEVVRNYRIILKYLRAQPSAETSGILQRTKAKFHEGSRESNVKAVKHMRRTAESYAVLVSDIKEISRLRALDSGEKLDPRDKIRATAARVGLSVPKFADEGVVESVQQQ